LTLREQIGNPIDIANSYNNLAHLYLAQLDASPETRVHSHLLSKQSFIPIIELLEKSLNIYTELGQGFEPEAVHELEMLAFCFTLLQEKEQVLAYATRARSLRKKIHLTSERNLIDGNVSQFFTLADPFLERYAEPHTRKEAKNPQKTTRQLKKQQKRMRQRRKQ